MQRQTGKKRKRGKKLAKQGKCRLTFRPEKGMMYVYDYDTTMAFCVFSITEATYDRD